MTITVLIAEDHPLLRQGLRALVQSCPGCVVVDDAASGRDAIQKVFALQPDVVLLDLSLPDMGGIDVIGHMLRRSPRLKIVALSEAHRQVAASEALRAGCHGYLLKNTSREEVALAIGTVVSGRRFICQELASEIVGSYLNGSSASADGATWHKLTTRERVVFRLVAEGKTNRAAAACLRLSHKTVEKHRASVMRKLELRSAAELMLLAVDLGVINRADVSG